MLESQDKSQENVNVFFSQSIHVWETSLANAQDPLMLCEAALSTDLVETAIPLEYLVTKTNEAETVLLEGVILPSLLCRDAD